MVQVQNKVVENHSLASVFSCYARFYLQFFDNISANFMLYTFFLSVVFVLFNTYQIFRFRFASHATLEKQTFLPKHVCNIESRCLIFKRYRNLRYRFCNKVIVMVLA